MRDKSFYLKVIETCCYPALLDSKEYINVLLENDYLQTNNPREASLILVNACTAGQEVEDDAIKFIEKFKTIKEKDAMLVIFGCLGETHKSYLRQSFSCPIFGPRNIKEFVNLLKLSYPTTLDSDIKIFDILDVQPEVMCRRKIYAWTKYVNKIIEKLSKQLAKRIERKLDTARIYDNYAYPLRISEGCTGTCSYCLIKKARGYIKSKPLDQILSEARKALSKSLNHFVLVCDDFASYGLDINLNFNILLRELFAIDEKISVSLCNVNPQHFIENLDGFLEIVKPKRIANIEYTVQHGSNRILKLMSRNHTIEEYVLSIREINRKDPDITFKTHLIVGFPGEKNSDFFKSVQLLKKIKFDKITIYRYSARPGTLASVFLEKVPFYIKSWRYLLLSALYNLKKSIYILTGYY